MGLASGEFYEHGFQESSHAESKGVVCSLGRIWSDVN
jgi:hypothetical protein